VAYGLSIGTKIGDL